ncbi:MAG: hypothetical protein K0S32_3851 [Bacteroidetes bacterium]|jgi:hypothetical protein|nr:hypothetical protein [Bacteroidota bacterium]
MKKKKNYYRLEEAEELRQTFSSWINKLAYIDTGETNILKRIIVKPKRSLKIREKNEKMYSVNFEFFNTKKIDALHFLINNGLRAVVDDLSIGKTIKTQ